MMIQSGDHAKERASERGAVENEVLQTLQTGTVIIGKQNRLGKEKVFEFNQEWKDKVYAQKQVTVIYIIENGVIIIITVLVKYGNFTAP